MTHLQVDPPSYLKSPPLGGTLPHRGRAEHLRNLLDARFPLSKRPPGFVVRVHRGECGDLYEQAITEVGGWDGPVFANLDGWGVDTDYVVVQRFAQQPSSEVLVTFEDQFFIRFAKGEQEAGERVFGHSRWRRVDRLATADKKPFLLELYREGLHSAGFPYVLTFEMIDEGGHSLHLFFGTTNEVAVGKFKDGLWEVDGVSGQRFRDPRDPNQLSFDILRPDFTPLESRILELLGRSDYSMAELCEDALLETIYRETHVKPVVDALIAQRRVQMVRTGRSYADRILRLAEQRLF